MIEKILNNIIKSDCTNILDRNISLSYDRDGVSLEANYNGMRDDFSCDGMWLFEEKHTLNDKQLDNIYYFMVERLEEEVGLMDDFRKSSSLVVNGFCVN